MKTNLFFSLSVLPLMLLAGCASDNGAGNSPSGKLPTVTLYVNNGNNATSRTQLGSDGSIAWDAGDVINVNGNASTACALSNNNLTAAFTVLAAAPYYGIYPNYSNLVYNADHTFSFTFPATQAYQSNVSFANKVNPSVGYSATSTSFGFYNLCGMLRIPVTSNAAAVTARFVSLDNAVAGTATATISTGALSSSTMTISGTTKTMDIAGLPSTGSYTLNFVLPTGTYGTGWYIQLLDAGGNELVRRTSTASLTIERSKITGLSDALKMNIGIYDSTNSVYWAPGNLVSTSTSSYAFASAQETTGAGTSQSGYYFCWNTLNSQTLTSTNTGATWDTTADPCSKVAPAGTWRTPTGDELTNLMAQNVSGTKNSVAGRYFGTTTVPTTNVNNYVFFPAAGDRIPGSTSMEGVGSGGAGYWASTPSGTANGYILNFNNSSILMNNIYSRNYGFPVRCVSTAN